MILGRAMKNDMGGSEARQILTLTDPKDWRTGGSIAGGNTDKAMKLSAVYRCVKVITESMGKLPSFVMDTKTKQHIDHPLLQLLTHRPNDAMTPSVFKQVMHANRLLYGNGYAYIHRNRNTGRPDALIPLENKFVRTEVDEDDNVWHYCTDKKTNEIRKVRSGDMLHYKGYSADGITGISVLEHARMIVDTGMEMQEYDQAFFRNNAQPAGVLSVESTLKKDAKDKIRAEWSETYTGSGNAFQIAVLDLSMKYQQIALPNKDSQFIENKAVTVEDIARFFGVPLYKLMAGDQSYASNEQNGIDYVVNTIHPIVAQCEEEDTYKLLTMSEIARGREIRQNMMAELRGDMASRGAWYKTMREIGVFSVDDICDLEDTPNVPGGDTRQASLNYVPLELFRELSINRNNTNGGGGN